MKVFFQAERRRLHERKNFQGLLFILKKITLSEFSEKTYIEVIASLVREKESHTNVRA